MMTMLMSSGIARTPALAQDVVNFHVGGNLGTAVGAGTNGVLVGSLTATAASDALLCTVSQAVLAAADDGGAYTAETTPANEGTADDITCLPATPAVNDAYYIGHGSKQFDGIDITISTQGAGTWTVVWEHWDGDSWELLADISDGTTGFTVAAGTVAVTWTLPSAEDPVRTWATCTVDSVLGYWVRARVSAYTSVTTQPLATQAWVSAASGSETWTDDTTDFNDAGAGDVALLPAHNFVDDAFYIGYSAKFCAIKTTTSTARTGTATLLWEYWNGTAWATLTTCDIQAGWVTAAGTAMTSFVPPTTWTANTAANGPNGEAGFFVRIRISALTSVTATPVMSQGWVFPIAVGQGVLFPQNFTINKVQASAQTASGANNDSLFLLINRSKGTHSTFTWTKADAMDVDTTVSLALSRGDELVIVQVAEDQTTEFADANFVLSR
jgi:hypothetical protein